jgi:hypothetical protein
MFPTIFYFFLLLLFFPFFPSLSATTSSSSLAVAVSWRLEAETDRVYVVPVAQLEEQEEVGAGGQEVGAVSAEDEEEAEGSINLLSCRFRLLRMPAVGGKD